ncbi:MAG: phospholipase D family protein [Candidatus Thioglobus sp.]|nr:phospholipase D family protein [Candidatus Thioglobus sp.]
MEVLSSSRRIADEISRILGDEGERIITVAYIGDNALDYLPNPDNLVIYCSTDIPGTNPFSLRELKNAGVVLCEVSNLHSKVYWSASNGVVIGSANLSNNGLSASGNHEVSVSLPSKSFDMKTYVKGLRSTPIDFKRIESLENKYNLYVSKNKIKRTGVVRKKNSYLEWSNTHGPKWRIYVWTEEGDIPRDVKSTLNGEHPGSEYYDFMHTQKDGAYKLGGFVLNVKENWIGDELESVSEYSWFIPEIKIMSEQRNASEFPYYWISLNGNDPHHVPFNVKQKAFQKAFAECYMDCAKRGKSVVNSKNKNKDTHRLNV